MWNPSGGKNPEAAMRERGISFVASWLRFESPEANKEKAN